MSKRRVTLPRCTLHEDLAGLDAQCISPGTSGENVSVSDAIPQNVFYKIQIILSIKRTALTVFRTGLAVCAVPLSLTSFLIATSRQYSIASVSAAIIPLAIVNTLLLTFGIYLVIRSWRRFIHQERILTRLRYEWPEIKELF
jgi:uncharacterized membrane protein YidH (DUF202 family)